MEPVRIRSIPSQIRTPGRERHGLAHREPGPSPIHQLRRPMPLDRPRRGAVHERDVTMRVVKLLCFLFAALISVAFVPASMFPWAWIGVAAVNAIVIAKLYPAVRTLIEVGRVAD